MAYIMDLYAPEIAKRQLICVNSHADWDHAWGNGYFGANVPIIVHESYLRSYHYFMANEELAGFQARGTIFRDVKIVSPSITFSENLTLVDGDLTVELQYAPGHCNEHIVAWFPEIKLLLAFDAVEYPLPSIESGGPAFATLKRLAWLKPQYMLCSHGNATDPALIQKHLNYMNKIKHRCEILGHTEIGDPIPLSQRINYSLDDALADVGFTEEIERTYYSEVHESNISAIQRWVLLE
jgi:glyoxylase-like metal-dependent hydrolase (beta-lactamase superfamily II)